MDLFWFGDCDGILNFKFTLIELVSMYETLWVEERIREVPKELCSRRKEPQYMSPEVYVTWDSGHLRFSLHVKDEDNLFGSDS